MKSPSYLLALLFLGVALEAHAQETVITRRGDGTTVVPTDDGVITITTKTVGVSGSDRTPRRLDPRQLERFLKERTADEAAWT